MLKTVLNKAATESYATREGILRRARMLVPKLAARSEKAEQLRRCPDETIADFTEDSAGLLRVCQPKRYGGYDLGYDVLCEMVQTLAQGCGSQAWVAMVLADNPLKFNATRSHRSCCRADAGHVRHRANVARIIERRQTETLAVTAPTRLDVLPDTPPLSDFLPGYETSFWLGIGAPKDTPREIVKTLNGEINAGLGSAKLTSQLVELGAIPMPMTLEQFGQLIVSDTEKWAKVVKFAGIKAD